MENTGTTGPANLNEDGSPPESRMDSALAVRSRVLEFNRADDASRAYKRAMVKGLVEGNPPYLQADKVAAGRGSDCNVNWRISESYLRVAWSGYYDLFSETPTLATCATTFGKGQEQTDWSALITVAFDKLLKSSPHLDYHMQNSQYDMVLYGAGPLMFRGPLDWRPYYQPTGMLTVPEMTQSTTTEWTENALRVYYAPDTIYGYIRHESAASQLGWDVEAVKRSIIRAHPRSKETGQYQNWEYHQQLLKNSSYYYSAESNSIHVGHYFFREFPEGDEERGRVTECMVDLSGESQEPDAFLFRSVRKYKDFSQVIHPMYLNHGGGGYHHSVIGLGVQMYGAMAYQNKLLCNLADKVFAPKVMFKPTSAAQDEQFNLVQFADYARIPAGFDMMPVPIQGHMEEGLGFNELIAKITSSNHSQYRKETQKTDGNPISAAEVNRDASQAGAMAKTDLNLYCNQADWLYTEIYRRASNLNLPTNAPGGDAVRAFQQELKDQDVPEQAIKSCVVAMSRSIGQGNAFLRTQTLIRLLAIRPTLPESGQAKLIRDYIASEAGYRLVDRYAPESDKQKLPTEHEMMATLQVNAAKDGTAPVITETQNHVIYATIFLKAGADVLSSIQKAGPQAIPKALAFLETIGPATHKHIDMLKDDPTRKDIFKRLTEQFTQMARVTDKLKQKAEQMAKQQQQGQMQMQQAKQIQNGQDPATQLKAAQVNNDIQLKRLKTSADLRNKTRKLEVGLALKARQTRQGLAATDLKVAQELRHNEVKTRETIRQKRQAAFSVKKAKTA